MQISYLLMKIENLWTRQYNDHPSMTEFTIQTNRMHWL